MAILEGKPNTELLLIDCLFCPAPALVASEVAIPGSVVIDSRSIIDLGLIRRQDFVSLRGQKNCAIVPSLERNE